MAAVVDLVKHMREDTVEFRKKVAEVNLYMDIKKLSPTLKKRFLAILCSFEIFAYFWIELATTLTNFGLDMAD